MNFDVWWFRLPRADAAEFSFLPRVAPGKALGVIPREGYDQIAYLGAKGTDPQLRASGIEAFRRDVSALLPESTKAVAALTSMDDIKHLDVRVDRLRPWHTEGLLCIGDPRTRCLRSEVSASTWRSKTPSRPRPYWPNHCDGTG